MEERNQAGKQAPKLRDRDVRIVYLPPASVASICCVGGTPEWDSGELLKQFVAENRLDEIKPDFRHYGFNHPNGTTEADHGYERWVTIPDGMEVKAPFVKKQFTGGMYGAHMIPMGAFEEWGWLYDWAVSSEKYELAEGDSECMGGCLEEHLNFIHLYRLSGEELDRVMQLDLLIPIREKTVESR